MKPKGVVDWCCPWFIPLLLFLGGYFLASFVEVKVKPVSSLERSSL